MREPEPGLRDREGEGRHGRGRLVYGSAKGAELDLKLFNDSLEGEAIEPEVRVTFGNEVLLEGRDYLVSYENNVEPGVATVTIEAWMSGNYSGSTTKTFKIVSPTGINAVQKDATTGKVFDLQGRRIKTAKKGVVIMNGKKTIVK